MKLLLLDPGLSGRRGHNGALVAEFDQEFRDWDSVEWIVAASAAASPARFADLKATVLPIFRLDGYARLQPTGPLDEERLLGHVETAVADLKLVPLEHVDGLLMPTCYPVHLIALSRVAARLVGKRVMIGMLMPAEFWAVEADAASRLGEHMAEALGTLQRSCEVLVYSEVGSYQFGAARIGMATLLPPVSSKSIRVLTELSNRKPTDEARPLKLGFFGSPFTTKGVLVIAEAAAHFDPARAVVHFRLPPGHQAMCDQLKAISPAIAATSYEMSNAQYFEAMADVDAVLAFYDPAEYGAKMSGIVPEAICLGKPLVVSDGCRALCAFLDRFAPGAFVVGNYAASDLTAISRLPAATWQLLKQKARASANVVRAMKSMRRYLAAGGLFEAEPIARQSHRCGAPVTS